MYDSSQEGGQVSTTVPASSSEYHKLVVCMQVL